MQHVQDFESITIDRVERERVARLQRAGVREVAGNAAPTSAFVAVETAVLVMVAALAMTSIIVTAGDPDPDVAQAATRTAAAQPRVIAGPTDEGARHAALLVAR
jgi:hypothetical protein